MTTGHRILVGVFGAPQGVRGEVRIKSYTGRPSAIGDYGPLLSEDGRRSFSVVGLRPLRDDIVVARIDGIGDRNAAAALTNQRLYVDRARLPAPEPDEFYHADLIGLEAVMPDGQALGRVAGVENYGAGDLLEVLPASGAAILVPFTKGFVPVIDFAAGRLVVEPGALGGVDEEPPEAGPEEP